MTIQEAARHIVYGTRRRSIEDDNDLLDDLSAARRRLDDAEAAYLDAQADLAATLRECEDAGVVDVDRRRGNPMGRADMTDALWASCDCCGRVTNRLHHLVAYGTDTSACDECCGYDAEAYDEEPARYAEETE